LSKSVNAKYAKTYGECETKYNVHIVLVLREMDRVDVNIATAKT
jgi:hypothetical protein